MTVLYNRPLATVCYSQRNEPAPWWFVHWLCVLGEREVMTEGKMLLLAVENGTLQGYGLHSREKVWLIRSPYSRMHERWYMGVRGDGVPRNAVSHGVCSEEMQWVVDIGVGFQEMQQPWGCGELTQSWDAMLWLPACFVGVCCCHFACEQQVC